MRSISLSILLVLLLSFSWPFHTSIVEWSSDRLVDVMVVAYENGVSENTLDWVARRAVDTGLFDIS